MIVRSVARRSRPLVVLAALVLTASACTGGGAGGLAANSTASAAPSASTAAIVGLATATPIDSATASQSGDGAAASPATSTAGGGYGHGRGPSATPSPSATAAATTVVVKAGMASGSAVLTGKGGLTLYHNTNDSATASSCIGACAAAWPPFVVAAHAVVKGGAGVKGAFRTITRTDGSHQVTYRGQPLYYYVGDSAAGDANGDGVGGVWYAAAP